MKVNFVFDDEDETTGLGRYSNSLFQALNGKVNIEGVSPKCIKVPSIMTKSLKPLGINPSEFLKNFPVGLEPPPSSGVVHFTRPEFAFPMLFKKYRNTVVTVYDLVPLVLPDREVMLRFKSIDKFTYNLILKAIKRADKIIAISNNTKKDIVRFLHVPEEKVAVIHAGVDHEKFKKLAIEKNEKKILFVGSEMPRKNLPTLIKAFCKLKKKLPGMRLIKVGEAQWQRGRLELLNLVESLNLQKDVKFMDSVPEADLPIIYNSSDLFVFPSLYEGFGLPALEAMACGTPVISSNASSLPEVVGDAGVLVDPLDVDVLAEMMLEVLTNEGLREELIRRGLKRAKMFTWNHCAEETVRVYEEVLDREA